MREQLIELNEAMLAILSSTTSIKLHIDRVAELRKKITPLVTPEKDLELSNSLKDRVQLEVGMAFFKTGCWGAFYGATGVGKTKAAIRIALDLFLQQRQARVLVVVPTEKLRDSGWPEELNRWGTDGLSDRVRLCCYASLSKYEGIPMDLVILDEGHNLTQNNAQFFAKTSVQRLLVLTATPPKNKEKKDLFKKLKVVPFYEISLDECTKLGLVAPYEITVITTTLGDTEKYLRAGSQKKGYYLNTEKNHYAYLSRMTMFMGKMAYIKRMQFIYNLKSKTKDAEWILDNIIPDNARTIIFCGSKEQASALSVCTYYSKPTKPKPPENTLTEGITPHKRRKYEGQLAKYEEMIKVYQADECLNLFIEEQVNRLACVEALNEGQNIPNLNVAFIVQLNSSDLDAIQRIGRALRYRPGHVGRIIVLTVSDTVDKEWTEKALANFSNVRTIELSKLKSGLETISFD